MTLIVVIARSLLRVAVVIVLVTLGTSVLVQQLSGDAASAILGVNGTPEDYARLREELGLNRSWIEQYLVWARNFVSGNLGETIIPPTQDIATLLLDRTPVTLELALLATLLAVAGAIVVGSWSAYRAGRTFDNAASVVAFMASSVPSFILALLIILLFVFNAPAVKAAILLIGAIAAFATVRPLTFGRTERGEIARRAGLAVAWLAAATAIAYYLPPFPRQGFVSIQEGGIGGNLRSLFLPVLTLALIEGAQLMRVLRGDMVNTLKEDFILAARAKGMPPRHILIREALKASSFSLITVAAISFGRLIGGTVIVESIFRLPGLGTLIVNSVYQKDLAIVQSAVVIVALGYILTNAAVDIAYTLLDPRVRRRHV